MTKKSVLAVVGTLALASAVPALTSSPATADTPGCVSRAEFNQVHKGMRKARVADIFDTKGFFVSGGGGGYVRGYKQCQNTVPANWWCQVNVEYAVNEDLVARLSIKTWKADCSIG